MSSQTQNQIIPVFHTGFQLAEWFKQQPRIVLAWHLRPRTRIALSKLDRHLLEDIGVSAKEADVEANKPFWKD